ncbi:MAG: pyrroline-5-carboxylate reductase [Deltaproteobacteria bacterium]|nr:pyrroline-5-carboxylate reductase [Deltaproteobacteria bacterium]
MNTDNTRQLLANKQIAIIGVGNMGEALLKGFLHTKILSPKQIIVSDCAFEKLSQLAATYNVATTQQNSAAVKDADIVLLAIKPQVINRVLDNIAAAIKPTALVISIAAGVSTQNIENKLPINTRVCRAMPNTPAIVEAGATAIAIGKHAHQDDLAQANALFASVGQVYNIDENLLDAVTGLSGSGPAYVFMIIEALADAGVRVGLPRTQSLALATQTLYGSAKLLIETGEHPSVLKDKVTSPGGTTIAGLHALESGGLRATIINAVVAATNKSRELAKKDS